MEIRNKYNQIYFSGFTSVTKVPQKITSLGKCISESHLMRNLDSTLYARNYLSQQFPQGGEILVPGCSLCEGYTWATLLHDVNTEKKYKVLASDIVPEVIEKAKQGQLTIGTFINDSKDYDELYLIKTSFFDFLSKNKKDAKNLFKKCFEKSQSNTLSNNIYKPKQGVFENILSFNVENANDISKTHNDNSAIAISFRNALYHVLGVTKQTEYDSANIKAAEALFSNFHKVLKKDGLLLIGNLPTEHVLAYPIKNPRTIFQGERDLDSGYTIIHEMLEKIGFKPIYYEENDLNTYLPTVWKKI